MTLASVSVFIAPGERSGRATVVRAADGGRLITSIRGGVYRPQHAAKAQILMAHANAV